MAGLLIEADHVAARVPEPSGDLGRIRPDWLHDLTAVSDDRVEGCPDAVDHDVQQQAGRRRWASAEDPSAAHFAGCSSKAVEPSPRCLIRQPNTSR